MEDKLNTSILSVGCARVRSGQSSRVKARHPHPPTRESPKEDVSRHHNPLSIVFARCYLWRTTLIPSLSYQCKVAYTRLSLRSLPSGNAVANKLRFKRLFIRLFMARYSCAVLVWRTFSAWYRFLDFFVIDLWQRSQTMGRSIGLRSIAVFDSWGHVYKQGTRLGR